ncbi:Rep [Planaria asexual strain-specific virus-like element type 1]|uniref:Rep n=1 Tax=Planaria asexual strain-specific virus-like element type 2 TaxID=159253 RepID=Q910M2_9VIRU|nr:Rep [Planaria asexual strain-specific virus-like element type 1]AAK53631.1 Rep [Planaria asexual strain-specific virus-like element type 1]AAK53636.1 Rep [Planaria asexual strain-specific virus-like element type 2]
MSSSGFRHIQLFITCKYATTASNVAKKFGVGFVGVVESHDVQKWVDYCTKVDTRVENGVTIKHGERARLSQDQEFWAKFLNVNSEREGMEMVERERPLDYIRFREKLEGALLHKLGSVTQAKFKSGWRWPYYGFMYRDPETDEVSMRSWVFVGKSGIGKTNFALSHFEQPLHVTEKQELRKLGSTKFPYDGFVLDDVHLAEWFVGEAQNVLDCRFACTMRVLYGTAHIPAGLRRIICVNSLDFVINPTWPPEKIEAIYRRIVVINLEDQPLY